MTRAEIRIAAAKRHAKEAEAALSKEYERQRAAIECVKAKHRPHLSSALRRAREARVAVAVAELAALGITPMAVAVAELAALGITPMRTIILWHPKGYTAPSAQNRYIVRVTPEGWTKLIPVGKSGAILAGRNEHDGPYSTGWSNVTVTDEEAKV